MYVVDREQALVKQGKHPKFLCHHKDQYMQRGLCIGHEDLINSPKNGFALCASTKSLNDTVVSSDACFRPLVGSQ